jgi:outer membrane receptor for ferrienterochelin and colicin
MEVHRRAAGSGGDRHADRRGNPKAPASISVITAVDIQRSSAKTAADLLRREEGW